MAPCTETAPGEYAVVRVNCILVTDCGYDGLVDDKPEKIPHELLRAGLEQKCYDFLKWRATLNMNYPFSSFDHDWSDETLSYVDIRGADAFEPIDLFVAADVGLSLLVALTLLKLRLHLDLQRVKRHLDAGSMAPVGELVRQRRQRYPSYNFYQSDHPFTLQKDMAIIESQFRKLCGKVHEINPSFWDTLIVQHPRESRRTFTTGTEDEAYHVLRQCLPAWDLSCGAIMAVDWETWRLPRFDGHVSTVGSFWQSQQFRYFEDRRRRMCFPKTYEGQCRELPPALSFPPTLVNQERRFVCSWNRRLALAYVDGACSANGTLDSVAGWAVVYGNHGDAPDGVKPLVHSGRLADRGPAGHAHAATSNRAELRAAIAALNVDWGDQGFDGLVVASDSSYVVDGATKWIKGWLRFGWKTQDGDEVKNQDLWRLLADEADRRKREGLDVHFWKIPRKWNKVADAAAKKAVRDGQPREDFTHVPDQMFRARTVSAAAKPRILVLALEPSFGGSYAFASLLQRLINLGLAELVHTMKSALDKLGHDQHVSTILVPDASTIRHRRLLGRVIYHLREGARVILAGAIGKDVGDQEFRRLFATIGLPWQKGERRKAVVSLRTGILDGHLRSLLPPSHHQDALFLCNVEPASRWYTEREDSRDAAVAWARVGRGRLGYIGEVSSNFNRACSISAILVMCGLKIATENRTRAV